MRLSEVMVEHSLGLNEKWRFCLLHGFLGEKTLTGGNLNLRLTVNMKW